MFCPNCGNHILDANASFCPNCGAQLNSFTQGNDQSSAQQDFQQDSQQDSQQDFQQDHSRIRSRIHSRTRSRIRSRTRSSRGIINSTTPRRSRTARRARLPQIITDSALQASRFPALQLSLTSFFSACPASWGLFCPLSDFVNAINVRKKDAALQLRELQSVQF